jgi:hypothetical protein
MYLIDDLKSASPLELVFRLLISGVGLLLLGFAIWMTVNNLVVINTHQKAVAEVVSSDRTGPSSSKGLNYYNVRLRFQLDNGKTRNTEISRSTTNYDVGEMVPIYYIEETGYKAIAGDFWGMWFLVIVVASPGLMFLYFGLRPYKKDEYSQVSA